MSENFDPYYQWLAIRSNGSPIDHYRLLGIETFESNPEVISNAAFQRTFLIRTLEYTEHGDVASRILGEINEAQECLLDPKRRADYDAQMKAGLTDRRIKPQSERRATVIPVNDFETIIPLRKARATNVFAHLTRKDNSQPVLSGPIIGFISAAVFFLLYCVAGLLGIVPFPIGGDSDDVTFEPTTVARNTSEAAINYLEPMAIKTPTIAKHTLLTIPDRTVEEGEELRFSAIVSSDHKNSDQFKFTVSGEPKGALFNSDTGELRWTPGESDGGTEHFVFLTAMVRRANSKSTEFKTFGEGQFRIKVTETNQPPVLAEIEGGGYLIRLGGTLNVILSASDPDLPAQSLSYRLVGIHPDGIVLHPDTGQLVWTPGSVHAGQWFTVHYAVHDSMGAETQHSLVLGVNGKKEAKPQAQPDTKVETSVTVNDEMVNGKIKKTNGNMPAAEDTEAGDNRYPLPDKESLAEALDMLALTFGEEHKAAKLPEEMLAFAKRLIDSHEHLQDVPADLYVTLDMARGLAANIGNPELALMATKLIVQYFVVEQYTEQATLAKDLDGHRNLPSTADTKRLVDLALATTELAIRANDVVVAADMTDVANRWVVKLRNKMFSDHVKALNKEMQRLKRRYSKLSEAIETLEIDHLSPKANLLAGQWFCFVRGEWSVGLPMLALSSSVEFKQIAKQDLAAVNDVQRQFKVAAAWWELAEESEGLKRVQLFRRSAHWYALAKEKLRGLAKQKAAVRLDQVDQLIADTKLEQI